MNNAWMPGVRYLRSAADGGPLRGGAPRAVWQISGTDPLTVSAGSAAHTLHQAGQASHLVWNPLTGDIVQLVSVLRAGRLLDRPEPARQPGGPPAAPGPRTEVNGQGRICVQILVIGLISRPFTDGPLTGLRKIMTWLDSWDVPRYWPAGAPASAPDSYLSQRSPRLWARGGHFGASQVPGVAAPGPGAIDVERLTGWRDSAVEVSAQRRSHGRRPVASGNHLITRPC